MLQNTKLGFIGGGNMAEAIVAGLLNKQMLKPDNIIIADPLLQRREYLEQKYLIQTTADNSDVAEQADVLVLAIKPQQFQDACSDVRLHSNTLVISILAGTPIKKITDVFGASTRVVRVMPNTPALVGEGMAGIAGGKNATGNDITLTKYIFEQLGQAIVVDEEQLHLITGVSGSGPAYVFYFVEALRDAAILLGMDADKADTLARQTFFGSVKLLAESGEAPDTLRKKVTSKGGTTEQGIATFDKNNLKEIIKEAIQAAAKRSQELSGDA